MLVNCVVYRDGEKLADIPREDIHLHLRERGTFVWVALSDPEPGELKAMQQEFNLHELAVEDAKRGHQRPKLEEYGEALFAVVHLIELHDGELTVGEVDIFAGANYVLSVRSHAERGFHDVRLRSEREPDLLRHGSGYVLYALIDAVVDRYFPVLDALEVELERLEEEILSGRSARASIESLYALKRKLTTMKHAVEPMLEAVSKLFGGRVPHVCAGLADYFRDVYDHLARLNQTIDSVRDAVTTAMTVNLSMITLAEGEVTKRLAAYAALAAVPTMIAGIYGMNFELMPELKWHLGYPFALGLMIGLDAYLFRRFRKAGWL